MNYLIQKFIETLKDYGYKVEYYIQDNGVWILKLYNLPIEIDVNLLKCKYIKINEDKNSNTLHNEEFSICIPNKEEYDDDRYLSVVLDQDSYATKMNLIDSIIKDYRRKKKIDCYI